MWSCRTRCGGARQTGASFAARVMHKAVKRGASRPSEFPAQLVRSSRRGKSAGDSKCSDIPDGLATGCAVDVAAK